MIRIHSWFWLAVGLVALGAVVFLFVNHHFAEVVGGPVGEARYLTYFLLSVLVGFALQRATRF